MTPLGYAGDYGDVEFDAPSPAELADESRARPRVVALSHDHDGYRVDFSDDGGETFDDGTYLKAETLRAALVEARAMLRDGERLDVSALDDAIAEAREAAEEVRAARGAA